jgi:hypothetical protein
MEYINECKITGLYIKYKIFDDTSAYMSDINLNFEEEYLCSSLLIIRNSIDELKRRNIKELLQYAPKKDYDDYLRHTTTWSIVSEDTIAGEIVYLLKCSITNAIKNIGEGIGIKDMQ